MRECFYHFAKYEFIKMTIVRQGEETASIGHRVNDESMNSLSLDPYVGTTNMGGMLC